MVKIVELLKSKKDSSSPTMSASDGKQQYIDELCHEAYAYVEQGICYDEVGSHAEALEMYEKGVALTEIAGRLPDAGESAAYKQVAAAVAHVRHRLRDLRDDGGNKVPPYDAINGAVEAFGAVDADEIFVIPFGVQLFMINGDQTTAPTNPEELKVFRFREGSKQRTEGAEAFMQVGSWVYPLYPGRSPVLHSDFGAYIVPNPTVEKPNLCVGILLPQDLDKSTVEGFRKVLDSLTTVREQAVSRELSREEQTRLGKKIAQFLIHGGELIAWGIKSGADRTGQIVTSQGQRIRAGSARSETAVNIDPRVQSSVHYLRRGSKVAVKVTSFILDRIADVGVQIGRRMASSLERVGGNTAAGGFVSGTLDVIGGGIVGASTVWMGLEESGKSLGRNIANETVLTIDHKYGEQAASTATDAAYAAGHTTKTAWNIQSMGVRGIAKRTASKAGMTVLKDLTKANEKTMMPLDKPT